MRLHLGVVLLALGVLSLDWRHVAGSEPSARSSTLDPRANPGRWPLTPDPFAAAIAAAGAHLARTDPGPAQFKAIPLERGFHVQVDHAAGYRLIIALSQDFKVVSVGPRVPTQRPRYSRCCGAR